MVGFPFAFPGSPFTPIAAIYPEDPLALGASTPTALDGVGVRDCGHVSGGSERPYCATEDTVWRWRGWTYRVSSAEISASDGRYHLRVPHTDGLTDGLWPEHASCLSASDALALDRVIRSRLVTCHGTAAAIAA